MRLARKAKERPSLYTEGQERSNQFCEPGTVRLGFGAVRGHYLFPVIVTAVATDFVGKGRGIAIVALPALHGVQAVCAGKSAEVATRPGLSLLRYCHSGANTMSNGAEIPGSLREFSARTATIDLSPV